ncbi:MAG: glycosyltransferase [Muribaculaceae bacterium]
MKVLWFCNTPALGEEHLKSRGIGGGWMKALNACIQDKVELSISFLYSDNKQFKYQNTSYYPIKMKRSLFNKIFNQIETDEYRNDMLSIINDVKPDIIHIHGTENPFGTIIDKTDVPIVISMQGILEVINHFYFRGISQKLQNIHNWDNGLLKSIFAGSPFIREKSFFAKGSKREIKTLINCKNIIGRTDWDKNVTRILAPNSQYFHVGEIMRDSFFYNQWTKHNRKYPILHTTNGNTSYKGFETLCKALTLMHKVGFMATWQVAGIAEDDLIVKVVKKALKKDYPHERLVLLGRLDEEQLVNNMLNADMYVMTSHIENSPNNLGEAMTLGMPCIATHAGGTSSLLTSKIEGELIQDGDPWNMAGSIIALFANEGQMSLYSKNAKQKAYNLYSKDMVLKDLLKCYSKIVQFSI